jgi:hypothetical protein
MNVFLFVMLLHIVPYLREHPGNVGLVHDSAIRLDLRWSVAVAGLWAMLSVWKGTQLIWSAIRLRRLANRAEPVPSGSALLTLLEGGRGYRAAEFCSSPEVERPSVFGFFRPRILVPPALLEKLSALELQQVVQHEIEHLRRGDDWTNLLQKVGLVLFPLNPVLMWVERRLCAERELACDDHVARSVGARKAYALCLTRLAEYSMIHRSLSLALGAWERRPELVRRVDRLLRRPHESMSGRQAALVTACLLLGAFGVAMTLARSPQLVSFAPHVEPMALVWSSRPASPVETDHRQSEVSSQLVKAVMPRRPLSRAYTAKPVRSIVPKRSVSKRYAQSEQAWVVVAQWSDTETPPQRVFAVAQGTRPSYAVIPFANGLLIVQI